MKAPALLRPRSLRGQLLLWLLPFPLLAAVLTGGVTYVAYDRVIRDFMDTQMEVFARSHAGRAGLGDAGVAPLVDDDVFDRGAFVVQLWSPEGRLLASTWAGAAAPLQPGAGHHDGAAREGGPAWRIYTAPPSATGSQVQVLQSEHFLREEVASRALLAGLPVLLLLPALWGVLWAAVGRSSRALRSVADEIARRDERRLGELPLHPVPTEIEPLVSAFNRLLSRLAQAFDAQRRFVQDAAHELRTPMTAVTLQLQNLHRQLPPEAAAEALVPLDAGLKRMRHLVDQLLRLSRHEAGAAAGATEPVDLTTLLRESLGQCMPLADVRRIEVSFDGAGASPVVLGVMQELRSVFDNLIDNALRYTPEGGEVALRLHEAAGATVVDIVDSGPGVPAELRERVFDRFYRVPGSAAGGSGLGLAITRAAARSQGLEVLLLARDDGHDGLVARVVLPRAQATR